MKNPTQKNESFFDQVYEIVRLIPYGRVTTYGAIANCLGTRGSARMVGWALNASFSSKKFVPAHRVVNRAGILTGKHYFGTATAMEELLRSEGVNVTDDSVRDFDKLFWDPAKEI